MCGTELSDVAENNSRLPGIPVLLRAFVYIPRNWIKFSRRQSSVDDQIVVGSMTYVVQLIPFCNFAHVREKSAGKEIARTIKVTVFFCKRHI